MKYELPKIVSLILTKLQKKGFQAYIVGGCVRDLLTNQETNDWDFTTDAQPAEIQKIFPDSFYDNKFGTVGIKLDKLTTDKSWSNKIFEITTFRTEFGYSNFRHPDKIVFGKSLARDLKRRDFTINAIACDGKNIIDPYDGQKDLSEKIIRAVGTPGERFQEDALRMIRAIRIATTLKFLITDETFTAIKENVSLLNKISKERIHDELLKILSCDYPSEGIVLLKNADILSIILPELEACFCVEQKSPQRHHIYDVGTHLVKSLEYCPSRDPIVRFATLLHDIGKPQTFQKTKDGVITFYNHEIVGTRLVRKVLERLKFSKKDQDKIIGLVRFHQFTVDERQTDSAVRRFIRNVGKENLEDILCLRIGDRLGGGARETSWRLELFKKRLIEVQKQPFTVSDLKVSGYDVMKICQIKPGPMVGKILEKLFSLVVEGKIKNEKNELMKQIEVLQQEFVAYKAD